MTLSDDILRLRQTLQEKEADDLTIFDNIRDQMEAEIQRQIVSYLRHPENKLVERTIAVTHIQYFVCYFFDNQKQMRSNPFYFTQFKDGVKSIFSSFETLGKDVLKIVLPLVETIDCENKYSKEKFDVIMKELDQKLFQWLTKDFRLFSPQTIQHLKTIIVAAEFETNNVNEELKNCIDTFTDAKSELTLLERKITLLNLIKYTELIPSEVKLHLMNKISQISSEQQYTIGQVLTWELEKSLRNVRQINAQIQSILTNLSTIR